MTGKDKPNSLTVGKVAAVALTVCGSLLTYIYVSNQAEDRSYIKSIAENVSKISVMTTVINEHLKNTDSMIRLNTKNISKNEDRLTALHSEARSYWRTK